MIIKKIVLIKIIIIYMILMLMPFRVYCQYLHKLYDIDSSNDWGVNIFIQPDSSYLIFGTKIYPTYSWGLFNAKVSSNGNDITNKNIIQHSDCNLYMGLCGAIKKISTSGYIAPFSGYLDYNTHQKGWGGLIKYNDVGDTIFFKTYTDTVHNYDGLLDCAVLRNGGYIAGGSRNINYSNYSSGLIICTDSMGDTIWTRTYQKFTDQNAQINNIIPLADGRFAVGAWSARWIGGPGGYYDCQPWYLLLDSMGNIIRDIMYAYNGSGVLYKDNNDGFFTIGALDILYDGNPNAMQSFPNFIAHLDTNFHTTWQTVFPYDSLYQSYTVCQYAKQLSDGSYVVIGDQWYDLGNWVNGWATKISTTGEVVWSHYYNAGDTAQDVAFLRGVAEKTDKSLVIVGCSHNNNVPAYWTNENLWLLGVDSNGCENYWCAPAEVKELQSTGLDKFTIYPNPTNGNITINTNEAGAFTFYGIDGRVVLTKKIEQGNTLVLLPVLNSGIYMIVFVGESGIRSMQKLVVN